MDNERTNNCFEVAENFNIPFIMFGEEGEIEYGGTSKLKINFL